MTENTALAKVNSEGLTAERQKAVEAGMLEVQRTFQENNEQRERIHKLLEQVTTQKVEIDLLQKALEIERKNTKMAEDAQRQAEVDRAQYETLFTNFQRILADFTPPIIRFKQRVVTREQMNEARERADRMAREARELPNG